MSTSADQKHLECFHIFEKKVAEANNLSSAKMRDYSRMKYGQAEATERIAQSLFSKIIKTPQLVNALVHHEELFISSAAYGSVPTASHAIMRMLVDMFALWGLNIRTFKIEREGSFHQANYGSLDVHSRQCSINSRQVFISKEVAHLIENKTILIVDDLRATGAHEVCLINLLSKYTRCDNLIFAYPILFEPDFGKTSPGFESVLNNAQIRDIDDLLKLSDESISPLIINARLVKFILSQGALNKNAYSKLLNHLSDKFCLAIHSAAISSDGYFAFPEYKIGFEILKNHLRKSAGAIT